MNTLSLETTVAQLADNDRETRERVQAIESVLADDGWTPGIKTRVLILWNAIGGLLLIVGTCFGVWLDRIFQ